MWWSRRALLAPLALAACGFEPLYAPGSAAASLEGRIVLGEPEGRFGFLLRDRLETRFGAPEAPLYRLIVVTRLSEEDSAILTETAISRINLSGRSSFSVTRLDGPEELIGGEVRAFTSYNTTASPFAADVAGQEAERRLAISLADQIVLRLTASAESWVL
ncbi:MAG: hypothetical protein AAF913_02955 [Pseudomonadota bacterium]